MAVPGALPIRQIAYFVPDIEAAARAHHAAFGSGPYFVFRRIPIERSVHRGVPQLHVHSSAYGQWGDVMVEFVEQEGTHPSAFHDLYPCGSGRYGMHHVALWVDDLDAAIAEFVDAGMPLAQQLRTETGTDYAFVDASVSLGHMIELYEPTDQLTGFYATVREAAQDWDGSEPIRSL